ncbi:MAG: HAMP domain-containing histidine kinase [Thermoanaerobaculia bacterium]|nr:HAMP domain-containing histidine kinase [Thermoanaerobaculia bacterium]
MNSVRPGLDRETTDQSLQTERASSDEAIAERRLGLETDADQLIAEARVVADSVLEAARETADVGPEAPSVAILEQRLVADQVVDAERSAADALIRTERDSHERLLAALMPLERLRTDRDLLTERARTDARLAKRDDFLSMVSHDLRGLLCGVLLESNLLADEATDTEEGHRTIEAAHRLELYVARMNRLVGDLIDVVSIDSGRLALQAKLEDARTLLSEVQGMFAPAAADKGVTLELRGDPSALMASYDHGRMLQVLANLISNAIKFTARGGSIVVRGERGQDELHFSVADEGVGVPVHIQNLIFERFWQVDENDNRGLGLGLHIAKCIVSSHGGRIWVESPTAGGSIFHVTIPTRATSGSQAPACRLDKQATLPS